jgi:hypothetical protein
VYDFVRREQRVRGGKGREGRIAGIFEAECKGELSRSVRERVEEVAELSGYFEREEPPRGENGGADERAERLVLFYQYLYKALGQREEQVATISSALRYEFETRGVNAAFFGLPLAVAGRKACKRTVDEKRVRGEELEATSILPLGIEAVQGMRRELWEGVGWGTAKEFMKRGA